MTSIVNYPNNKKLVKQLVTLDKNYNIKEAQVIDENNNAQIKMVFNKIDLKAKFDDNKFDLNNFVTENSEDNTTNNMDNNKENNTTNNDNNIKEDSNNSSNESNKDKSDITKEENTINEEETETKNTATIEDIIYPMYLPTNTYLKTQEKVNKEDGQRLILTFDGDSPFILIEETVIRSEEHEITPTFGELTHLSDTIGVVNENSVNWYSGGIEYYVLSDKMNTSELLEIARSISVIPVSK